MMHASGEIRRRTIEIQQGERQCNQTQTLQVPVQCCSVKRGRYVSFLVRQRARHNHWGPCNLHCICMMHVGSCLNLINAMNRSEWIAMHKLTFRLLSLSLFPVNIGGFFIFGENLLTCHCRSHHVSSKELRLEVPKSRASCQNRNLTRRLSAMPSRFTNRYVKRRHCTKARQAGSWAEMTVHLPKNG